MKYDGKDDQKWRLKDFRQFIYDHSMYISTDTCLLFWNVLGFGNEPTEKNISVPDATVDDTTTAAIDISQKNIAMRQLSADIDFDVNAVDTPSAELRRKDINVDLQIRKNFMIFTDVRRIFGACVIAEKYKEYSVSEVISAKVQMLMQGVFTAEQTMDDSSQNLYSNRKTVVELQEELKHIINFRRISVAHSQRNLLLPQQKSLQMFRQKTIQLFFSPRNPSIKKHRFDGRSGFGLEIDDSNILQSGSAMAVIHDFDEEDDLDFDDISDNDNEVEEKVEKEDNVEIDILDDDEEEELML